MRYAKCPHAVVAALILPALLAGGAKAQTTTPATLPTTAPAPRIAQPIEFLALAAKARKIKGLYVKGSMIVETHKDGQPPAKPNRLEFEIWVSRPNAMVKMPAPVHETRLSDGKFVYTLREAPGQAPQGRQRRLTAANYYHALEVAAVVCDAADGYRNLADAVKFTPIEHASEYAKKDVPLQWFRLDAVTRPPHHLVRDVEQVKVGMHPADGLARVLTGQFQSEGGNTTVNMVFDVVKHGPIKPEQFRLPHQAAAAKWEDADLKEPIPPPLKKIEPPKP